MLKNIPKVLSPDLLKALCEMGHSDTLAIVDANFPAESMGKNAKVIRLDGADACETLEAVLKVFPLDSYVNTPASIMDKKPHNHIPTPIWDEFIDIIEKEGYTKECIEFIDRFDFYERSKKAYLIIATSESAVYADIILQKGVIA